MAGNLWGIESVHPCRYLTGKFFQSHFILIFLYTVITEVTVFFYTHKISLLMKIPQGRTYANTLRGLRARGLRPSTPKCEMHKGCRG